MESTVGLGDGQGREEGQRVGDPAALLLHQHLLEVAQAQAAELDGHVGRRQPELDRPRLEAVGDVGRQLARVCELELVDVVGQQRRDRRKEGDVEEDHRRGQPEQAPHAPIQSVARGY